MDEELRWIKDETPYILFRCTKCRQHLYVKTAQKTKKCLRCGVTHKVVNIIHIGEIIYGLSKAIEMVKERQHKMAIKELGNTPEFNTFHEFKIIKPQEESNEHTSYKESMDDFSLTFITILEEIQKQYNKFPLYVIELKAEEHEIPKEELKILIKSYLMKGILIKTKEGFFTFKK